jgi:hypothetical protein
LSDGVEVRENTRQAADLSGSGAAVSCARGRS